MQSAGQNSTHEEAPEIKAEAVSPYGTGRHKGEEVREMFDSIAPRYDVMNTLMTFGLHRRWRDRAIREALRRLNVTPSRILDVATGTGDLVFTLRRRLPEAQIIGADLSDGMLAVARRHLAEMPESERRGISFEQADCLQLPYAEDSFDLVTVAYGVRNFEHLEAGYREMLRVLRPGGVICVIELSAPPRGLSRLLYNIYSGSLIPIVGKLVSGDSRAYSYLPESIAAAPQRQEMATLMERAGFAAPLWHQLTLGAVTFYTAIKDEK